ncbi:MAG: NAD(P)H-dependent oxidoreductase subunit E, partial [Candidatus Poribacteria bacterium]
MTHFSDDDIIARWKEKPAPLLPMLHDFHDRDGYLSEGALRAVAQGLRIPIADLFGTVSFYHHFSCEPGGLEAPRVCTGPICKMNGADELLGALDGATAMPCSGRCDEPIPVLRGHDTLIGLSAESLESRPSPLPPAARDSIEECVFAHIRESDRASLDGYRNTGGYEGLVKALAMAPVELVQLVSDSGLAGRGGAGFPTGRKWKAVADAEGDPKTIVCNADEGEPGCFKDRCLMDYDPHAVVEGMILAAYATGATRGFIYLRYEYPETEQVLAQALDEARRAGLLGYGILGSDFSFEL